MEWAHLKQLTPFHLLISPPGPKIVAECCSFPLNLLRPYRSAPSGATLTQLNPSLLVSASPRNHTSSRSISIHSIIQGSLVEPTTNTITTAELALISVSLQAYAWIIGSFGLRSHFSELPLTGDLQPANTKLKRADLESKSRHSGQVSRLLSSWELDSPKSYHLQGTYSKSRRDIP